VAWKEPVKCKSTLRWEPSGLEVSTVFGDQANAKMQKYRHRFASHKGGAV